MCLMNSVFNIYLDKFELVFLHDILVYSKNEEEHEENLRMVFQVFNTTRKTPCSGGFYGTSPKRKYCLFIAMVANGGERLEILLKFF